MAVWTFGKKKKINFTDESGEQVPAPKREEAAAVKIDTNAPPHIIPAENVPAVSKLTPREREVFTLLIEGAKLKDIAEVLGVKFSTVNTHQKSIYKKLGVNTRAECIIRYGK
ncbi:hypothetical protein FACS18947_5190 [Bacteroidia bacterium]|nr:hypothetical protein FACS18947_5190 [Bacteroidia bacterium]